jgi:hypothetical protein
MFTPKPICFKLFTQAVRLALSRAAPKAGSKSATSTAMIATATRSSINVNPLAHPSLLVTQVGQSRIAGLTPPNK